MSSALPAATAPAQLFVRHARKEGRSIVILRALDYGESCAVEAEVFSADQGASHPGPYSFTSAHEAVAFVTEAVEALMYLGCDVQAE